MSGFFSIVAALTLVLTKAELKLTVSVYNMAKVHGLTLGRAEKQASKVFREAGIELEWMHCPCPQYLRPKELMLRIIPRLFGSMHATFLGSDLGFAPTGPEGGDLATIFYDHVEKVAKGGDISAVLGCAIAHELGHLLLGQNAHSVSGIMHAHWSRSDLKHAKEILRFTSAQAERMCATVTTRSKQLEGVQASGPESPK